MRPSPIDHLKPPVPYVKGWKFTAKSHTPPSPTICFPSCCVNDDAGGLEREQLHPVERCLRHPPLPGSDGTPHLELELCETIRTGNNHNAQLAVVKILETYPCLTELPKGKRAVAKFYDSLYFFDDDGYLNPFLCADKNYTHETATKYAALSDLRGSQIPEYYGSFTMNIPPGESKTRCVRLILIEFIPGKTMRDIDPKDVTRADRQCIMKAVVDFETLLYTRNLVLRDNHPRNTIICNARGSTDRIGVVFLDFGDVLFGRAGAFGNDPEFESEFLPGTYISPLLRWHVVHRRVAGFDSWIDWDWQHWLEEQYGLTAASITEEIREKFLPSYLLE